MWDTFVYEYTYLVQPTVLFFVCFAHTMAAKMLYCNMDMILYTEDNCF